MAIAQSSYLLPPEIERARFARNKNAFAIASSVADNVEPLPRWIDEYKAAKATLDAYYADDE